MVDEGPTSNRLQREESQLWRWALGLFVLFAAAVAALSWQQLKDLPYRLWAIPAGLFALTVLFAAYAFGRKREVSELQQILKGFQDRAGVTPSEEQLDQLGQLIMRSQRNFKELIDSLDDVALAISLDGTLRTVNRRTAEILGVALQPTGGSQTGRISSCTVASPGVRRLGTVSGETDLVRSGRSPFEKRFAPPLLRLRGQCHRQERRRDRSQRAGA